MIDRAVYNLIKTAVPAHGVYEILAPQGTAAPFVVYTCVSEARWKHLQGPSGMAQDLFQIDVYGATSAAARALAATIETALDGFSGLVYHGANSPQDSVRIGGVSKTGGFSLLDQAEEPFLYRASGDYLVTYERN